MALGDDTITEINLGVEAETAHNTRDRVPIHFNDLRWLPGFNYFRCNCRNHVCLRSETGLGENLGQRGG
jgi:hypothetical protein